jgi:hypothetical protein
VGDRAGVFRLSKRLVSVGMYAVDRLLDGKPELQSRFRAMAGDPGVSGDMLHRALLEAGIPVRRWAVFNWRKQFRLIPNARTDCLFSRVVAAVREMPDDRLQQIVRRLRLSMDSSRDESSGLNRQRGGRKVVAAQARTLAERIIVALDRVGRSTLYRIGRELGVAALPDGAQQLRYRGLKRVRDAGFSDSLNRRARDA